MKKLNNKGFVLAETLIVCTFVLILFVLVYRNGIPLIGEYQKLKNYDDVDSVYAANLMKDIIQNDANYESIVANLSTKSYLDLTDCSLLMDQELCKTAKTKLNITAQDKIFFTFSDPSKIKAASDTELANNTTTRKWNSYITYLDDRYSEETDKSRYLVMISRTLSFTESALENGTVVEKPIEETNFGSIGVDYE